MSCQLESLPSQDAGVQIRVQIVTRATAMWVGLKAMVSERSSLVVVPPTPNLSRLSLAERVEEVGPDVVLLDWDPGDGAPWVDLDGVTLVVLAADPHDVWTLGAMQSGVRAVLPQDSSAQEIGAAIEAVAAGLVVLLPEIAETWLSDLTSTPTSTLSWPLTAREIEVLTMVAEGLGNKTIAKRLGISEHTVKFHIGSIFTKLNVSSRTEAVMAGARQGMILL